MARLRTSNLRRFVFVDPKVQGALVLRVAFYWLLCLVSMGLMLLCWRILSGPIQLFYTHFSELWLFYAPAAIASFLLLPLVMLDVIRLSNRFVGPVVRLRRAMRALARGEHVQPLEFREGDFWQDFAAEFNAVAARAQGQAAPLPLEDEDLEHLLYAQTP
jgi:hypothetical protein